MEQNCKTINRKAISEPDVAKHEQLLDFSSVCISICYVILCSVLFCMFKSFTFSFFLMKGSRQLEIRVNGDKWPHQSSERMICGKGLGGRLSPESRDYED